jgi:hypothetical protein
LDLLTPNQLAAELLLSVATLARWRMEKIGPPFLLVGHRVRYRRPDVEAWLARRSQSTREGRTNDEHSITEAAIAS